jgi:hypothetical protein
MCIDVPKACYNAVITSGFRMEVPDPSNFPVEDFLKASWETFLYGARRETSYRMEVNPFIGSKGFADVDVFVRLNSSEASV